MKRTTKTLYVDSKNRDLISIKDGNVSIECAYQTFSADQLEELSSAASAAAEELRSLRPVPAQQSPDPIEL